MNQFPFAVIRRNSNEETLRRIAEFSQPDYLANIKPSSLDSWIETIGLRARFSHWGFETRAKAEAFAKSIGDAAHVIQDDEKPWTAAKLHNAVTTLGIAA